MKKNFVLLVSTALCSCALTPDYQRPEIALPGQWQEEGVLNEAAVPVAATWWESFGSAELNALVAQALQQNNDLLAGIEQVAQARAALGVTGAGLWPTVSGSAGAGHTRTNPTEGVTTTSESFSAGVSVAYEVDLFGANRAATTASEAALLSTAFGQQALELVVMADVADTYFSLLSVQERLALADKNLANAEEVLRIVQARVDAGTESELTLAQQMASVATTRASRASLLENLKQTQHALALLLGQPPEQSPDVQGVLDEVDIPVIQAVQPSALLEQRPDIRAAEANLLGAHADIGAARAAFFPALSLGATGSWSALGLTDPATLVTALSSSLTQSIFKGGSLKAGLAKTKARQRELVVTYRQTVLTAFQEVEDALAAVEAASVREMALKTAMEQSQKAYRLSKQRYDAGSIDFQTLLDTQNSQLSAEDSYAQAKLANLTAAVTLFKVFGGGMLTDENDGISAE